MTPAEHVAEAERLLTVDYQDGTQLPMLPPPVNVWMAIAHALVALAVENGVPHAAPPAAGGTGAG